MSTRGGRVVGGEARRRERGQRSSRARRTQRERRRPLLPNLLGRDREGTLQTPPTTNLPTRAAHPRDVTPQTTGRKKGGKGEGGEGKSRSRRAPCRATGRSRRTHNARRCSRSAVAEEAGEQPRSCRQRRPAERAPRTTCPRRRGEARGLQPPVPVRSALRVTSAISSKVSSLARRQQRQRCLTRAGTRQPRRRIAAGRAPRLGVVVQFDALEEKKRARAARRPARRRKKEPVPNRSRPRPNEGPGGPPPQNSRAGQL